jgi:nucleoside 2-deoxyribosyltransferase
MKKIRCYLAGWFLPLNGFEDWREYFKEMLKNDLDFYDPRTDTKQGSIASFVYQDLVNGVDGSDIVFYFVTDSGDVGSAIECGRADCGNKPVILCIDKKVNVVHPFLIGIAKRVFSGPEAGVAYLKSLAKHGLKNEFKAIEEVMKRNP